MSLHQTSSCLEFNPLLEKIKYKFWFSMVMSIGGEKESSIDFDIADDMRWYYQSEA